LKGEKKSREKPKTSALISRKKRWDDWFFQRRDPQKWKLKRRGKEKKAGEELGKKRPFPISRRKLLRFA